jgi:7-keto-8-aminopelargonate synthetase-like enzyme
MDFEAFFKNELDSLHQEGRYRVFADLERQKRQFPEAPRVTPPRVPRKSPSGVPTIISVWASIQP